MDSRRTSKYLSLILRHAPEKAGLTPDEGGWVDLDELLAGTPSWVTRASVERAVKDNDKRRFTIHAGRIRANQGHSIRVDLGLTRRDPPSELFHGTFRRAEEAITRDGLKKMTRHHVHLAAETGTAVTVGRRSGTPVVFRVDAGRMHSAGHHFFCSENGVWLTDHVPPEYLERVE